MHKIHSHIDRYSMFIVPTIVFITLALGLLIRFGFGLELVSDIILVLGIILGSVEVVRESVILIMQKTWAIDYIAILAIVVSLISKQYIVGSVIVLMISGGGALEKYAQAKAKSSLTALTNRIPHDVLLYGDGKGDGDKRVAIVSVQIGQKIFVRKGEVIPLDGILLSDYSQIDESSLTGEAYLVDKMKGDKIRSGTVNLGNSIVVSVTKEDKNSTYRQIINMVKKAQEEKSPAIRLAHKYNGIFTIFALILAGAAWFYWKDFNYVLAVLVIATPCPLLLATPIALIGGMSASARKKIIVKNLASIESLSRANTLVFDKTGTITLGKPVLKHINIVSRGYNKSKVLSIAEAIERNSLHPVAHSIIKEARRERVSALIAKDVVEKPGSQISGSVGGNRFTMLRGNDNKEDVHLMEGRKLIAEFIFEDVPKADAKTIIDKLGRQGMDIHVFTGDKKEAAMRFEKIIDLDVDVESDMSPEDKQNGIKKLKRKGKIVAMVGDGINDAPALALADVGMVFSHEEHTASSEAADIVFLGGTFSEVYDSIRISQRTMKIAKQSIFVGLGLSVVGMFFAAGGLIIPIVGAVLQEAIDVSVILNSLRALGSKK